MVSSETNNNVDNLNRLRSMHLENFITMGGFIEKTVSLTIKSNISGATRRLVNMCDVKNEYLLDTACEIERVLPHLDDYTKKYEDEVNARHKVNARHELEDRTEADGEPGDKDLLDKESIDKEPIDKEPIDKDIADKEPIDKELIDKELIDKEIKEFRDWFMRKVIDYKQKTIKQDSERFWENWSLSSEEKERLRFLTDFETLILDLSIGGSGEGALELKKIARIFNAKPKWIIWIYQYIFNYPLAIINTSLMQHEIFKKCYENLENWRNEE